MVGLVPDFLHDHPDFRDLLAVVSDSLGVDPMLVEKDYWIMHGLWGLKAQGFVFSTSSKGPSGTYGGH